MKIENLIQDDVERQLAVAREETRQMREALVLLADHACEDKRLRERCKRLKASVILDSVRAVVELKELPEV